VREGTGVGIGGLLRAGMSMCVHGLSLSVGTC
jgi:hypothetical protein